VLGVEQEPAWCSRCKRFVCAEHVASVQELEDRIRELQTPSNKHDFLFGSDRGIEEALAELRVCLTWRETRQAPPHCLECGSTEITPIRFDNEDTCIALGKRFIIEGGGFADMADWIAEFTPEGIRREMIPTR